MRASASRSAPTNEREAPIDTPHRAQTRARILDAAWKLARAQGLAGWSLRDLAAEVGMRAPSLYGYFDSKEQIYDSMFAQGYADLLAVSGAVELSDEPHEAVRQMARVFVDFAVADPARMQLLFWRVIPGFTPSPTSYGLAEEALTKAVDVLAAAGHAGQSALDLWTALLTGLVTQQVSNDPGGDRWVRLVDEAVDMFLAAERV
ncbi:TetR/AcrR family transcriptional regulator [Nocardioides limicola]|uniref:TetR/AcrR family transcriptional regulator n=1 Tax=Nocardioides limicola TaxID=2803368 RepID=UPI00193B55B3|nr:TetR/AcrR family transcriptional regulator [Nocardioides sp. DJM-14]